MKLQPVNSILIYVFYQIKSAVGCGVSVAVMFFKIVMLMINLCGFSLVYLFTTGIIKLVLLYLVITGI